ncbi:hypothetical protein ONS95_003765 [Cadophora gregata]|uniref:uncharacterized protein n=1 Tax=Cadophora gregata TaxID=51156 RepID=UPI0026DB209A|nr:uncharacterized protein ONS95_003765 [Cadophora gregata]KAK0107055.1 hypothetical protein ONS95_003765 [Cadophora gregata]
MMTSNATPQDEPVATAILDDPRDSNSNIDDELTAVARSDDATGNAQQGSPAGENMPLLEDIQMGGMDGPAIANPVEGKAETETMAEGNEERRAQVETAAPDFKPAPTPAIPESESDFAATFANITAMKSNPDVMAQMVEARAFLPNLIGLPQMPEPSQDLHSAAHASIPHDGQIGMPDMFGAMAPLPATMMFGSSLQEPIYFNSQYGQQAEAEQKVQGFARIDFDDGKFYLNSYQLMIGRDLRLQKVQARRSAAAGTGPMQISATKPKSAAYSERGGFVRGFDEGEFEEEHGRKRKRKARSSNGPNKRVKKSKSSGSSSQHQSRRPSLAPPVDPPQNQYLDNELPAKVNIEEHQPSPHKMVTLYIHPPYPASAQDWKAISRQHLLIAFNFDQNLWEGRVMGRNGCFVEDELKHQGETFQLTNGCHLQIGAVELLFRLPEHIPIGKTGAEEEETSGEEDADPADDLRQYEDDARLRYVVAGKEMSLDFRNLRRQTLDLGDESDSDDYGDQGDQESRASDEDDDIAIAQPRLFAEEQESESEEERLDEEDMFDDQENENEDDFDDLMSEHRPIPQPRTPEPKKRGVGRPPKDGISKRQQREEKAARLAKEALQKESKKTVKKDEKVAKEVKGGKGGKDGKENKENKEGKTAKKGIKTEPGSQPNADPVNKTAPEGGEKRKVGRPRKHPRPDTPPEPREKRKYTKRKPKEPKDGETKADGEGGDGEKDSKEQKPPRSPRSPTPTYNEAELTEEQMAKPSCNYVQLIYEALSESKHKQMSLPQIYRAIQRKYPYFVLKVSTVGWQSSVRHNLGQNEGFEKVERDGKGWKWAIKEGATFEKEKKKKASPPPQYPPGNVQIYPGVPHGYSMQGYLPHGMMMPGQGYHMQHPMPTNYGPPGQPQPYMANMGHQPHMNGPYQPGFPPPRSNQPILTIPSALAPQAPTSYSSPYGPKPAASTAPSTTQPSAPTNQTGSSASQPGPPTSQQNAQMSQTETQTGQSSIQTNQGTRSTTELGQSEGEANQQGQSTKPPTPPGQSAPSAGQTQTGPPNVQPVTNQHTQGASSPSMLAPQVGYEHSQQPRYPHYPPSQHFSQSFTSHQSQQPQVQHRQAQPSSQSFHSQPQQPAQQPAPPQTQPQDVQQTSSSTPQPVHNEKYLSAVESFRTVLTTQMLRKPNGREAVDRAVSKVLGHTSDDTPGSRDEAQIVEVLRDMLKKIGLLPHAGASSTQSDQRSPPPTIQARNSSFQLANHTGTQEDAAQPQPPANSTVPRRPSATVTRPAFTQNQNRPSGPHVPRPPINNLGRFNSTSSNASMRQRASLGSPVPPANLANETLSPGPLSNGPSSNAASTLMPPSEIGELDESKKEAIDEPVQVKTEQVPEPSPPSSQTAETRS